MQSYGTEDTEFHYPYRGYIDSTPVAGRCQSRHPPILLPTALASALPGAVVVASFQPMGTDIAYHNQCPFGKLARAHRSLAWELVYVLAYRRSPPTVFLVPLILHLNREQSRLMGFLDDRWRVMLLSRRHGRLVDAIIRGLVDLLRTPRKLIPKVCGEIGEFFVAHYCCALVTWASGLGYL
jgi:hypothetical protein